LERIARSFIQTALSLYEQAGMDGKVSDLLMKYSIILKPVRLGTNFIGSRRSSGRRSRSVGNYSQTSEIDLFSQMDMEKRGSTTREIMDIDISTVLKVTNSITNETDLDKLVSKILKQLMNNTGATRAIIFINDEGNLQLEKILTPEETETPRTSDPDLLAPMSLINYVFRTGEAKVYADGPKDAFTLNDPYFELYRPRSIATCPIKHQKVTTGIVYLENRLQSNTFTVTRMNLVKSLMASASISISNTQLLQKNIQLSRALHDSHQRSPTNATVQTPIQKVLAAIAAVKGRFDPGDPVIETLDGILATLTSDGLFSANLGEANDREGKSIDIDTKNWIENSLLMTSKRIHQSNEQLFTLNHERSLQDFQKVDMEIAACKDTRDFLEISGTMDFDVFKLAELTEGQPLFFLSFHLLSKYRIIDALNLKVDNVQGYFRILEKSYNNMPYHHRLN
jgi:hypothetical protein